jgi:hypothetical protein
MRVRSLGLGFALLLAACGGDDASVPTPAAGGSAGTGGGSGSSGAAGRAGQAGQAGNAGSGAKGGAAGSAGQAGSGAAGTAGSSGLGGNAGASGTSGQAGSAGSGGNGTAGSAGSAGSSTAGQAGAAGQSGASGAAGSAQAGAGGSAAGTGGAGGAGTCVSGVLCGPSAVCCGAQEECVENACKPACASGVRCGDVDTCCGAGDVCIAGACTQPGGACADYADCNDDEFCDPVLGKCLPQSGEPACVFKPPVGQLSPKLEWSWTSSKIKPDFKQVINTPLVADIDRTIDEDGKPHPEVVIVTSTGYTASSDPAYLRLLDGRNGLEKWGAGADVYKDSGRVQCRSVPAIGDIDGDGKIDIVAAKFGGGLIAFNGDGSLKWTSKTAANAADSLDYESVAVTLADLDGDGKSESIVAGVAYDSTGKMLFNEGTYFGSNTGTYGAVSIVADVAGDARPEILSGARAIDRLGNDVWTNGENDGYPAIGDLDLDGKPELVVVSTKGGKSEVRVQNAATGAVLARLAVPGTGAGGPPTIAQFDGVGGPDFALANGNQYAVFRYEASPTPTIALLWSSPTQDLSSNRTGSTVFDFEGDGKAEVVYNDECYLRVYRGSDGQVIFKVPNPSATIHEYPVVADVDGDNNTEIIVGANDATNNCVGVYEPGETVRHGVFVYGDANDRWVRTRRIWNQHSYHVTNVGPDGSIPKTEANSWGPGGFNNYRQSTQGKQAYNAPDLAVSLQAGISTCAVGLQLRAHVKNEGSVTAPAGIEIAFYKGSPPNGTLLQTVKTKGPLLPGAIEDVDFIVPEAKDSAAYYVVADGNAAGVGVINECIESNNTGAIGVVTCSKD